MGYLVSFLGGALGFAVFDKSTQTNNKTSILSIGIQALLVYYLFNKFSK